MKEIPKEQFDSLKELNLQVVLMNLEADRSALRARVAELELQNAQLIVFLKNNLSLDEHQLDLKNGIVVSKKE